MRAEDVTDEMLRAFVNAPSPQLADDADLGDVAAGIAAAINAMEAEPVAISIQAAHNMGANGATPTEAERALFEAWMRGHCWALGGEWNGRQYVSTLEADGDLDPRAMQTRQIWAAWRDRAALGINTLPPDAQDQIDAAQEELRLCQQDAIKMQDECIALKAENARLLAANIDGKNWVDASRDDISELSAELAHKQAKIDALMFDFCPGEMTGEQIDEWMKHQVVSDPKAPEVRG